MRAVVTRCSSASVEVAGETVGELSRPGLLALVGVTHGDGLDDVAKLVRKIAELRILADERSALDLDAPVLVVSQFTLYGGAADPPGRRLRQARFRSRSSMRWSRASPLVASTSRQVASAR